MSQRTAIIEDQEIVVNIELKVTLKSFSNHDGYTEDQVDEAIHEFRTSVGKQLEQKVVNSYYMEEFLHGVDFVYYEVESNDVANNVDKDIKSIVGKSSGAQNAINLLISKILLLETRLDDTDYDSQIVRDDDRYDLECMKRTLGIIKNN